MFINKEGPDNVEKFGAKEMVGKKYPKGEASEVKRFCFK
jgi:hypothetical protein